MALMWMTTFLILALKDVAMGFEELHFHDWCPVQVCLALVTNNANALLIDTDISRSIIVTNVTLAWLKLYILCRHARYFWVFIAITMTIAVFCQSTVGNLYSE